MLESLLNKVAFRPAALLKETLTQVFSCDTYKIFKSNFFLQNSFGGGFCKYTSYLFCHSLKLGLNISLRHFLSSQFGQKSSSKCEKTEQNETIRGVFRTLSNILRWKFCKIVNSFQLFAKCSILDVWQGSKYTSHHECSAASFILPYFYVSIFGFIYKLYLSGSTIIKFFSLSQPALTCSISAMETP